MNNILRRIISVAVVLVGVGILVYPSLSEYLYRINGTHLVDIYDDSIDRLEQERRDAMLAEAVSYNSRLVSMGNLPEGGVDGNVDPAEDYWNILDVDGNGMMGYLTIPRLSVQFPVYHGAEETVLQVAIGHLRNTSLPVGGESTHAALTGHRGLPTASLLTDLDKMQVGDEFYVKVLERTLAYETDQILTVLPNERKALAIEPGKDYMTLVTCTPYGINSHRLLVRGHRVPYTDAELETILANQTPTSFFDSLPMQVRHMITGVSVLFGVLLLRWGVVSWAQKRQRRIRYYDI